MTANLERFKSDLDNLIKQGNHLVHAIQFETLPEQYTKVVQDHFKGETIEVEQYISALPSFKKAYQRWYSESLALLCQLLPDRVADFTRHYEKPKGRKDLTFESYRIDDYLQGVQVSRGGKVIVDGSAAISHFLQQFAIVEAAQSRFESSLFEMRQLVQADLLDSELEAAEVLCKHKFYRAAGALAGVVIERHLSQVCTDRALPVGKKNPTISDFNEMLKANGSIDIPQWRFIQHLADIRNLCDHSRVPEPTAEQVTDLLNGAKKITKTVY